MKKISSYEIALSALACAIATVMLTVGTLYAPLLFTGYLFASAAFMLPLSGGYYAGAALAYVASSVLTLVFNGVNFFDTLPFIMFFGLHPIVNAAQRRLNINRWIALPVKAAWFDASMYVIWKFVFDMNTAIPFVDKYILPVVLIAGTAFFVVYDIAVFRCQNYVNAAMGRFIRRR